MQGETNSSACCRVVVIAVDDHDLDLVAVEAAEPVRDDVAGAGSEDDDAAHTGTVASSARPAIRTAVPRRCGLSVARCLVLRMPRGPATAKWVVFAAADRARGSPGSRVAIAAAACCTRRRRRRRDQVWRAAVALLAAELAFEVGRTVVVDHHLGVDTIALVAMVGALALGEELAGAVIGLMFTGGAALEAAASRRARRELTALVERAPRVAQLRVDGAARGGAGRARCSRRHGARAHRERCPGRRHRRQRRGGRRHEHAHAASRCR